MMMREIPLRCLGCGETLRVEIIRAPSGFVTIRCGRCREISFVQVTGDVCIVCGALVPHHRPDCPMAAEQQLWGV